MSHQDKIKSCAIDGCYILVLPTLVDRQENNLGVKSEWNCPLNLAKRPGRDLTGQISEKRVLSAVARDTPVNSVSPKLVMPD